MNVKHTPGPWNVGQDSTAIKTSGAIIARTFHWANQYTPIHESHANAKLIAAAPDLLKALQELLPIAARSIQGTTDGEPILQTARAAIAKATGKTRA